jgi:hypothetical protein
MLVCNLRFEEKNGCEMPMPAKDATVSYRLNASGCENPPRTTPLLDRLLPGNDSLGSPIVHQPVNCLRSLRPSNRSEPSIYTRERALGSIWDNTDSGLGTSMAVGGYANLYCPAMCFVHPLATADPQAASRATSAVSMLIALALLLGLFMLGVVSIMVARRIRQRRTQQVKNHSMPRVDPWSESAKRLQPYPRQNDQSQTDDDETEN